MNPTQLKILVTEDETFIADLYSHVLQKAGYAVKTANDGQTALNILAQEQFNLMLLDIMMPGMNGLEVLRQWKLKNPHSQMTILLLTNLGQDSVIKEGFELGAQGYLIKSSMTPDQVVIEVQKALKNVSATTPTPQADTTSPAPVAQPTAPEPNISPQPAPPSTTPEPTITASSPQQQPLNSDPTKDTNSH